MWVGIIIALVLGIIITHNRSVKAKEDETNRLRRRQEEEETRKQQKIKSILIMSREMKKEPRLLQLVKCVIRCANKHRNELEYIYETYSSGHYDYGNVIRLQLKDMQKDRWAPIQRNRYIDIKLKDFDIEFKNDDERTAFLYLILFNCPYLIYRTYGGGESRDLRSAYFDADDEGHPNYGCTTRLYMQGSKS